MAAILFYEAHSKFKPRHLTGTSPDKDPNPMDINKISKKKEFIPISNSLRRFLATYGRESELPISYVDLLRYQESIPLYNQAGENTLWETVLYGPGEMDTIHQGLISIYAHLKASGIKSLMKHLFIERIDMCAFGNSKPFRVRIVNQFNDNYDHFYVKKADASRVYGLELEDILSPSRIQYLTRGDTLIEEHIPGVPGDQFIATYFGRTGVNKVRIAKEFVKFNERCFVRLLGDMRSYNYIVEVTPDFEEERYRVRPIDFDQQSYEGANTIYLPQFFSENKAVVDLCIEMLNPQTVRQYQQEERSKIARRFDFAGIHITDLLQCMCGDTLSTPEKITQLKTELAKYHKNDDFLACSSMGEIVCHNLQLMLFPERAGKEIFF